VVVDRGRGIPRPVRAARRDHHRRRPSGRARPRRRRGDPDRSGQHDIELEQPVGAGNDVHRAVVGRPSACQIALVAELVALYGVGEIGIRDGCGLGRTARLCRGVEAGQQQRADGGKCQRSEYTSHVSKIHRGEGHARIDISRRRCFVDRSPAFGRGHLPWAPNPVGSVASALQVREVGYATSIETGQ